MPRSPGLLYGVTCAFLTAGLLGCAGRGADPAPSPSERIAWPPPPAEARIEYVRAFNSPEDLGIKKVWISRLFSYLARGRQNRRMQRPYGVTSTSGGFIAVADPGAARVHLFDLERSKYEVLTGPEETPFASPMGVTEGPGGQLFVSDSSLGLVFRYLGDGKWGSPLGEGDELDRPTGLAWDPGTGRLYVVETGAHRVTVFDDSGQRLVRIGERGEGLGEFNYPVAVAVGPGGRLFVSDSLNFRVQIFHTNGTFLSSFGQAGTSPGDMDKSKGIAVDPDGHIYLADALHDVIQIFDETGRLLSVIGGTGTGPGQFWLPSGLHISPEGRILVADSANGRVQILKYLAAGSGGEGR